MWIDINDKLPNYKEKVFWRGIVTWRSADDQVSHFEDSLSYETEGLDYGKTAKLLCDNSDFVVLECADRECYADEFVTHWMPIPKVEP